MAYTSEDLEKLQAAISKGARRVKLNGEEVEFRSLDEMFRVEKKILQSLNPEKSRRSFTIETRSGWRDA